MLILIVHISILANHHIFYYSINLKLKLTNNLIYKIILKVLLLHFKLTPY